ncbi:glycosyltransferase, partial [Candidatus Bathyarchaeota archaeon]|nr:glycosyltransferase [Candidatus Bathyarchaeota archaeon]
DHTYFLGQLPRQEAYKWLKIADVTVDPLRRSLSTVIAVTNKDLEYMAAQKTIVASDLLGHREVFKDGYNSLLFKTDDPLDLADKIYFLASHSEDQYVKKLGINAKKDFIEKYCWENERHKILDLYGAIMKD